MSTKFVLNSGGLRSNPEKARAFFAELLYEDSPRLLVCIFARPREDWELKFNELENDELGYMPSGTKLELAFPETLEEQMSRHKSVYFPGGDDHLIQYWLKQYDLKSLFEDKVVGTNSAATNAMAAYSWTCDWRKCIDGLGIVQIKVIPHYKSDYGSDDPYRGPVNWDEAEQELKSYGSELPIHALEEGDYVIIEQ